MGDGAIRGIASAFTQFGVEGLALQNTNVTDATFDHDIGKLTHKRYDHMIDLAGDNSKESVGAGLEYIQEMQHPHGEEGHGSPHGETHGNADSLDVAPQH